MPEDYVLKKFSASEFVHNWAKLRFGVNDEYGQLEHEKYPLFIRADGRDGPILNACTTPDDDAAGKTYFVK